MPHLRRRKCRTERHHVPPLRLASREPLELPPHIEPRPEPPLHRLRIIPPERIVFLIPRHPSQPPRHRSPVSQHLSRVQFLPDTRFISSRLGGNPYAGLVRA